MKIKTTTLDKIAALLFFALLTVATLCFGINTQSSHTPFVTETAPTSPYQLLSFKAEQKDDGKYLDWKMISEHDNFYFALERSVDGENYSVMQLKKGFASPVKGQALHYLFADRETVPGEKIYYRIRLLEVQATDIANKKPILSAENMLEDNALAAVSIINNKQLTASLN
jgi:hypothetical protein